MRCLEIFLPEYVDKSSMVKLFLGIEISQKLFSGHLFPRNISWYVKPQILLSITSHAFTSCVIKIMALQENVRSYICKLLEALK